MIFKIIEIISLVCLVIGGYTDEFDEIQLKDSSDIRDPYAAETYAVFTCSRCQKEERILAQVTEEIEDGITYRVLTAEFKGTTYVKRICLSHLLEDVDGDGNITVLDATTIQKRLALLPVTLYYEDRADADGDGEVTVLDATAIQKWLALLLPSSGIGKPIT